MLCFSADAAVSDDTEDTDPACSFSFDNLCIPLYEEMIGFARRMTGGDEDRAGDVVQESFKKALLAWPRWRPETENPSVDARAWLYRIVSNTYIKSYHRARRVRRRGEECRDEIMLGTYGRDREDDLRDHVDSPFGDEVAIALGALTDDHREIVEMLYVREMGAGAIAEELGVPKGTVYSRVARAHAALEEALSEYAVEQYGYRRRVPRAVRAPVTRVGAGTGTPSSRRRVGLAQASERVRSDRGRIDCVVAGNDRHGLERRQFSTK